MSWDNAFSQQMLELALSEEDFDEYKLECSIKQPKVTKEELQQLSIDENFTPYEKIVHILRNGQEVQKIYALENLDDLVKSVSNVTNIYELIDEMLSTVQQTKIILIHCAEVLLKIIRNGQIRREDVVTYFFHHIIKNLKFKDKDISSAWLDVLVASISILKVDEINQILAFLEENISLTCCSITRHSCCKILSNLLEFVDQETVVSYLIPKMKALCQDIELEIRSQMCMELQHIIEHSGKEIVEEYVLPELMLLFQDEESNVREVSFSTLTSVVARLSEEYLKDGPVVPQVMKFYRSISKHKNIDDLITAAKYIGKVLYLLKGYLSKEEKSCLLECFETLCCHGIIEATSSFDMKQATISFSNSMGVIRSISSHHFEKDDKDAQCRYWCAYNFPAVLLSIPIDTFKSTLHPSFVLLIKDNHPAVRKTMALCLHEVAAYLDHEVHFIFNSLKTILTDPDMEVLDALLTHLPDTLECFLSDKIPQSYIADLLPILVECEEEIAKTLRWRTHEKLLRCISCLHKHVPSDQIYTKLVPILQKILTLNKVRPVKLAAGHTLLVFLKHNSNMEERNEICKKLVADLARSRCNRDRLLFLDLCYEVSDLFSKHFFKEHFYEIIMTMAMDPVINVRLKFCKTLPLLKSRIKLPCDRLMLQTLEQTVRRIMALENDPDMSKTIRNVIVELDAIRLSVDGMSPSQEDMEDRKKETEEELMVERWSREEHLRSISMTEKTHEISANKKSRKSFTGVPGTSREKKVSSKGSLTTVLPKKSVSNPKTKDLSSSSKSGISPSASASSASKLTFKKSSSHATKRTPK